MNYHIGQQIFSFRVHAIRHSEELKADAIEFRHDPTGCRILFLDNNEENKVFSVAFRTLPDDSTGVFHILEHSVLSGSEKYPVREPFVELLKGSMNTFLNALTFPDMTMYPVSSRNDRDLLNLTEVYLDAVFRPLSITHPNIFYQEGWHIEMDEEGHPLYKGVVLNEMKGAMSDAEGLGERTLLQQLFRDNAYGFNSGGDPERIPDLTYENYVAQYHRHYHPSNARIYLEGKIPMAEMLSLIASYLNTFEKLDDLPETPFQTPVSSDRSIEYELGQDEEASNKNQIFAGNIVGSWKDRALNMAISLIGDVLTGANDAPLKRRILEKGLAQDFSLTVDDSCAQSYLLMHAENVTDGQEDALLTEIQDFGEELTRTGLDPDAVESSLNRMIFNLKEDEEPRGIGRAIHACGIWFYEGDPVAELENNPLIAEIRAMVASGDLNRLAAKLLTEKQGFCVLRMHPSKTLGDRKREEEARRLDAIVSRWTPAERKANEDLVASLRAWQNTPDSPEALATLPMLNKADADIPPDWVETEELSLSGVRYLRHLIPCGGIVHLRISFTLSDFTPDQLQRVSMVCALLGKLPTAKHDALTIQQEIKRWTGRLSFGVVIRSHPEDPTRCSPTLAVFASVLPENVEKAQTLISEILFSTDFSATSLILELVQQIEMAARQRIIGAGHVLAARKVLSHYSAEYALKNMLDGDESIRYIHQFVKNPDQYLSDLRDTAGDMVRALCRRRALLSLTADEDVSWAPLLEALPEGNAVPEYMTFSVQSPSRLGYRIPSQVGFAVRGYRLSEMGLPFTGTMWLAANILSLSYLWNKVRVLGGAYGAGLTIDRQGNIYSYSYRDPTPGKTLTMDGGLADFLREFVQGDESLDKYIISSLNDLNPLLSPREKGALADSRWLNGYTREAAEKIRREILYATEEDLLSCSAWLNRFAQEGAICVVAPQSALDACPNLEISEL